MKQRAYPIAVIVELDQGVVRPSSYELVAFARVIQQAASQPITAIVLGHAVGDAAADIARRTGVDVIAVSDASLSVYNGEAYKSVLSRLLHELSAGYVLVAGSSQGSDFAPGLAVRLQAACITQVEALRVDDGGILCTRKVFSGKIEAEIQALTGTVVMTIEPGTIAPLTETGGTPGRVVFREAALPPLKTETLSRRAVQTGDARLADAKVVVAAGRGIGDEEDLSLVRDLAACIPHAVVGGSRPVVDNGWLPYGRQVGVTGTTVSPALYVACGISGAAQHVSGMRTAGFIVSINRDPGAAIFQLSDVCIVEDLKTFVPVLIDRLSNFRKAACNHE